jgi:hypothetical protein
VNERVKNTLERLARDMARTLIEDLGEGACYRLEELGGDFAEADTLVMSAHMVDLLTREIEDAREEIQGTFQYAQEGVA